MKLWYPSMKLVISDIVVYSETKKTIEFYSVYISLSMYRQFEYTMLYLRIIKQLTFYHFGKPDYNHKIINSFKKMLQRFLLIFYTNLTHIAIGIN